MEIHENNQTANLISNTTTPLNDNLRDFVESAGGRVLEANNSLHSLCTKENNS